MTKLEILSLRDISRRETMLQTVDICDLEFSARGARLPDGQGSQPKADEPRVQALG
ncbi:MAG: hypothetical protein UX68_C0028G0019 [Parcubacteria group bacterium GW2011_GWA2_46_9]|nr:MAG: hypothetical protein UX68_C0028G0019 [Parcubacteria group bacterium GW2011_GWA2_46_9]